VSEFIINVIERYEAREKRERHEGSGGMKESRKEGTRENQRGNFDSQPRRERLPSIFLKLNNIDYNNHNNNIKRK